MKLNNQNLLTAQSWVLDASVSSTPQACDFGKVREATKVPVQEVSGPSGFLQATGIWKAQPDTPLNLSNATSASKSMQDSMFHICWQLRASLVFSLRTLDRTQFLKSRLRNPGKIWAKLLLFWWYHEYFLYIWWWFEMMLRRWKRLAQNLLLVTAHLIFEPLNTFQYLSYHKKRNIFILTARITEWLQT